MGVARGLTEPVSYQQRVFTYRRSTDQDAVAPVRHPVIVVGAGPVGLSLSVDLAQRGIPVVVVDADDRLASGSRSICVAQRTLEIFDRLKCGDPMVAKGVSWNVGKVYLHDDLVYQFDLQPEAGHQRPAFINLQQYYMEGFLVDRIGALSGIDLRWKNTVVDITVRTDSVTLTLDTPDGPYRLAGGYVVACDGARSTIRQRLGLATVGQQFEDHFLIADIRMKANLPAERRFWFDPPFHPHQNVLLHRQPDDLWRIDFQLGRDVDPDEERKPENVVSRVRSLVGRDTPFELEWASVYSFASLRMCSFRHGRVFFAGDAAHGVSPFGARGANSGVQDAENLAWKLAYVLQGRAGEALLDSYCAEREYAAEENILHSTRSANFISPPTEVSRVFRDATLALAKHYAFARTLVNSGRLSTATVYSRSPLNSLDIDGFAACIEVGGPAMDAPVETRQRSDWLLHHLADGAFTLLVASGADARYQIEDLVDAADSVAPTRVVVISPPKSEERARSTSWGTDRVTTLVDSAHLIERRYDMRPGSVYLLRPDQHVCARWRAVQPAALQGALRRALGFN